MSYPKSSNEPDWVMKYGPFEKARIVTVTFLWCVKQGENAKLTMLKGNIATLIARYYIFNDVNLSKNLALIVSEIGSRKEKDSIIHEIISTYPELIYVPLCEVSPVVKDSSGVLRWRECDWAFSTQKYSDALMEAYRTKNFDVARKYARAGGYSLCGYFDLSFVLDYVKAQEKEFFSGLGLSSDSDNEDSEGDSVRKRKFKDE